MIAVNNELSLYDPALLKKPQIVAVNKIDKPEVRDRAPQIEEEFKLAGIHVRFVSAATGEGVKGADERGSGKIKGTYRGCQP